MRDKDICGIGKYREYGCDIGRVNYIREEKLNKKHKYEMKKIIIIIVWILGKRC